MAKPIVIKDILALFILAVVFGIFVPRWYSLDSTQRIWAIVLWGGAEIWLLIETWRQWGRRE